MNKTLISILIWFLYASVFPRFLALAQTENNVFDLQLTPYKTTYFLSNHAFHIEETRYYPKEKKDEVKIQLSFQLEAIEDLLFFAYTHKAFYQVYDQPNSRPFREHNYNPEIFFQWNNVIGMKWLRFGLWEHESNGERYRYDENGYPINYSRTWNRMYLFSRFSLDENNIDFGLKVWEIMDTHMDKDKISYYQDNPDLIDYMGNGELYLYIYGEQSNLTLMFRKGHKIATETWELNAQLSLRTLGLNRAPDNTYLHFQWFEGFGESLIDYNRKNKKFGIGLSFF